ncbi:MAG: R2-like ligand-binding oxidase [Symbiobacteriaceae bacterium]|nr:MAG: R2-like ligand-binding oxidase [Bacillota bacterium]
MSMSGADARHEGFVTTSARGLRHDVPPMRLYHKAKRFGVWDPQAIDLSRDREDWAEFNDQQRDALLRMVSLFQAGEESVTLDLLPLMMVIAREGRLEEEMYLTTFLWEEAKHTEFFRRFLDEVAGTTTDLHHYHTPSYKKIFYEELPRAMNRLLTDPSPAAQAEAAVTYNLIVEGVLAETGYYAFYQTLHRQGRMPGLIEGIRNLQRDESRHIAYGVFLLSRLVAQDDSVWFVIERRLNELLPYALGVTHEIYAAYGDDRPFDVDQEEFVNYAIKQFTLRSQRIEQARGKSLDEVYRLATVDADEPAGEDEPGTPGEGGTAA